MKLGRSGQVRKISPKSVFDPRTVQLVAIPTELSRPTLLLIPNTKINNGMDTRGEKKKKTSQKNVDGRSTSSHDSKKFRTISMEKQRGMASGFRKTATAVIKLDRLLLLLLLSSSSSSPPSSSSSSSLPQCH
jgi:hypothetical protein